jgi:hypothetical protein
MPCYTTIDVAPFQTMCLSEAAKESGTGTTVVGWLAENKRKLVFYVFDLCILICSDRKRWLVLLKLTLDWGF